MTKSPDNRTIIENAKSWAGVLAVFTMAYLGSSAGAGAYREGVNADKYEGCTPLTPASKEGITPPDLRRALKQATILVYPFDLREAVEADLGTGPDVIIFLAGKNELPKDSSLQIQKAFACESAESATNAGEKMGRNFARTGNDVLLTVEPFDQVIAPDGNYIYSPEELIQKGTL